jgi:hypothetical protein
MQLFKEILTKKNQIQKRQDILGMLNLIDSSESLNSIMDYCTSKLLDKRGQEVFLHYKNSREITNRFYREYIDFYIDEKEMKKGEEEQRYCYFLKSLVYLRDHDIIESINQFKKYIIAGSGAIENYEKVYILKWIEEVIYFSEEIKNTYWYDIFSKKPIAVNFVESNRNTYNVYTNNVLSFIEHLNKVEQMNTVFIISFSDNYNNIIEKINKNSDAKKYIRRISLISQEPLNIFKIICNKEDEFYVDESKKYLTDLLYLVLQRFERTESFELEYIKKNFIYQSIEKLYAKDNYIDKGYSDFLEAMRIILLNDNNNITKDKGYLSILEGVFKIFKTCQEKRYFFTGDEEKLIKVSARDKNHILFSINNELTREWKEIAYNCVLKKSIENIIKSNNIEMVSKYLIPFDLSEVACDDIYKVCKRIQRRSRLSKLAFVSFKDKNKVSIEFDDSEFYRFYDENKIKKRSFFD